MGQVNDEFHGNHAKRVLLAAHRVNNWPISPETYLDRVGSVYVCTLSGNRASYEVADTDGDPIRTHTGTWSESFRG